MHSFTYTQKSCRQPCGRRRCICLRAYIFSPHTINTQTPAGRPAGKKNKKVHTLYIHPKPHFQPAAVLPMAPPLLSHPANLPAAGRNMTNHHQPLPLSNQNAYPHFAGSKISIQRSKAKATTRPQQHGKKGTYSSRRRHIHIFSPTFPASFKAADREHTSNRRREKRYKKVQKGIKRG